MERLGKESLVIFTGNVVARQNTRSSTPIDEVYLAEKGDRVLADRLDGRRAHHHA